MKEMVQHIAVVSINRDKYSETFIHDAFDFFPGQKSLLYGAYLPTHLTSDWRNAGKPIPQFIPKFWQKKPANESAQQVANVQNWLQNHRPDVFLAHYGPSGVMMAPICKALKIPLVVHFHGYDAFRADILNEQGRHYPILFENAAHVVVPSMHMQQQLVRLGCTPEKIHVLPYGANLDVFQYQAFPAKEGEFNFAFVGRLVAKKAPDLLIRAFAQVQTQVPQAQLRIAGEGELMGACRQLVHELGLEQYVMFLGVLSPPEVADLLAQSHALVLPSRQPADGDSEGTPLVVMEAGAVGRPVIATHHAGIPEVIRDHETGFLIPPDDEAALLEAMLRFTRSLGAMQSMSQKARAVIEAGFSQAGYHAQLWQLLQNACNKARIS